MSDDKKTQMSAEVTVQVKLSDIKLMFALMEEALEPRVKFNSNMTAMENEAAKILKSNIEDVKRILLNNSGDI